jgi:hypothetical protein
MKMDIARYSQHVANVPIADTLHCEREDMNFGFFVQQLAGSTHLARRPLDPDRKTEGRHPVNSEGAPFKQRPVSRWPFTFVQQFRSYRRLIAAAFCDAANAKRKPPQWQTSDTR